MDMAIAHDHSIAIDVVNAFCVWIKGIARSYARIVQFAAKDLNSIASRLDFDAVSSGIVDFAIANRDVTDPVTVLRSATPIPIRLETHTVIIAADDFEVFQCAAVYIRLIVPNAACGVFDIRDSGKYSPFARVGADGKVAFGDADFIADIVPASKFDHIARIGLQDSFIQGQQRVGECAGIGIVARRGHIPSRSGKSTGQQKKKGEGDF